MLRRANTNDVFDRIVAEQELNDAEPVEDELTDGENSSDATEDAAADDDVDTSAQDEMEPGPRTRSWLRRGLTGVAAALFIGAVGLAGFFGWQLKQERDTAAAGQTALEVARNYAAVLTSVDSGKVDENFAEVLNGATGEFKDMYSQSAAQLRQLLVDNKAVSHGSVVDAAVKSATRDKVEVLIFVDQSISNTVNPQPRIDRSRVAITMEHVDDRWLASKVDIK